MYSSLRRVVVGRAWKPAFLSKSKDSESVGTRDEFNEIRPIENLTKV